MTTATAPLADTGILARIWPLLFAAALGLVPFTVFSNFLVDIAGESGADIVFVGGLRGLGGLAALAVGFAGAPLLDRLPRHRIVALALVVLALACAAGAIGSLGTWIVFCLLVGAATSLLNPAVSALAADRFESDADSARAATMVSSTMTLTAMLAAPLLALPAMAWGWRGDLVATGLACIGVAWAMARRTEGAPAAGGGPGYAADLRVAVSLPGVLPLLAVSALRTAVFMGQLAYIAAYYAERFGLGSGVFSLVWTLSGFAFFIGNWFGGRLLRAIDRAHTTAWIMAGAVLLAGAAVAGLFTAGQLPVALAATASIAIAHAVIAACVTTLLVRNSTGHRGTVLGLNGAGQSLGVFAGAGLAGWGLAQGAWGGVAAILGITTAVILPLALWTLRSYGPQEANP